MYDCATCILINPLILLFYLYARRADEVTCEPLQPDLIIYNRVPKAASTTLLRLLSILNTHTLLWVHSATFNDQGWWRRDVVRKLAEQVGLLHS